jgi:hypothetical protein
VHDKFSTVGSSHFILLQLKYRILLPVVEIPLVFGLPNISILSELMRHKLSKWPYAELKITAISILCYFHLSTTGSKIL